MAELSSPSPNDQAGHFQAIIDSLHEALHTDDLKETLGAVIKGVRRVVGLQATAAITLVDRDGRFDGTTYCVDGPLADLLKEEAPRSDGISAWVTKRKEAVFEENVPDGEDTEHPPIRQERVRVGAYACLLLASRGRAVGTLFVTVGAKFTCKLLV